MRKKYIFLFLSTEVRDSRPHPSLTGDVPEEPGWLDTWPERLGCRPATQTLQMNADEDEPGVRRKAGPASLDVTKSQLQQTPVLRNV